MGRDELLNWDFGGDSLGRKALELAPFRFSSRVYDELRAVTITTTTATLGFL